MKLETLLPTLLCVVGVILGQNELSVRIASLNIRLDTIFRGINEAPWSTRNPLIISQLNEISASAPTGSATLVGLQEVLNNQLTDIKSGLGSDWAHIGVARDDGNQSGEYCPILYRKSELRLLHNETKWLSPTPNSPSSGWGAGSRRIITLGVFEQIATRRTFISSNTHLDNLSSQARSEGVRVILEVINSVQSRFGPLGVLLTGDFNSAPGDDAYKAMEANGYMRELYNLSSTAQRFGPYETYTGFIPLFEALVRSRIDFIWAGPFSEDRWDVQRYEVLSNIVNDVYTSDHRSVVGDLSLRT
jgi:endonuclease/exonuclease/phosphatase family metal-dependent hydrolase